MRIAILALTLLGTGCWLPGDIRDLQFAQKEYATSVSAKLDMLERNAISAVEAREQIDAAQDELDSKYDRKIEEVATRTATIAAAVERAASGDSDGLRELLIALGTAGVSIAGGVTATNYVRNQKYKKADGAA